MEDYGGGTPNPKIVYSEHLYVCKFRIVGGTSLMK